MTKKQLESFHKFAVLVSLSAFALSYAGSVDNRNNNSAEYIRSVSRNAALDAPDIMVYNPAGTIKLQDGLHVSLDNQMISKFNSQDFTTKNPFIPATIPVPNPVKDYHYESDIFSPLYPTAFVVYKKSNWSAFTGFSFPGGGGALDYETGAVTTFLISNYNPTLNLDANLKSIYYGITAGGAYSISDLFSLSLAVRGTYARTDITVDAGKPMGSLNSSLLVDHMEEARGAAVIAGADFFLKNGINIGLRVESQTPLEWEVQKSTLNLDEAFKLPYATPVKPGFAAKLRQSLLPAGTKFERDLPANLGLGVGYAFLPNWRSDFSANYYVNTLADWGKNADGSAKEDGYSDGYEVALSLEHQWALPLLTSIGGNYSVSGSHPSTYNVENPAVNNYTIGAGGRYAIGERLFVNAGYAASIGFDDSKLDAVVGNVDMQKRAFIYSLGLSYRFL